MNFFGGECISTRRYNEFLNIYICYFRTCSELYFSFKLVPYFREFDAGLWPHSLEIGPLASCEIPGGRNCTGPCFCRRFLCFHLLIFIPQLLHTHPSPLCEMCFSSIRAVRFHILSLEFSVSSPVRYLPGCRAWELVLLTFSLDAGLTCLMCWRSSAINLGLNSRCNYFRV